ncbi:NUMOD3 domain-containing DNA-binding protein [Halorussus gelatinilyticus]|uniref:NUMOD3 domain-containing DNA-binding protein n=1 Tax=Halorussus gelatinilyticus TaxID=2937524 RepID=A0A8U0IK02_9EURY|nr:NUMOD3 domain-containing DNA-binding protein [Halorussus gelatinilyticus]UPW00564.1 NUMOD3 domain-containing DNA-binding protein [Halorussus gelatinilyticus]
MKRYQSGHWLKVKYRDEGLTQKEIADECGVSPSTIRKYMKKFDIPTREMRGENHPMHGRERTEEEKRKISESLEGRSLSEETRRRMSKSREGNEIPDAVRERIATSLEGITRSKETRQKMSKSTAGEDNPNWRGGYSKRYGSGWSVAREAVRERDEVCQHCGHDGTRRRLEVHHIVPVRVFRDVERLEVEDAHAVENLVLLCKRCHGKADHGKIEFDAPIELLFEA